MGATGESYARSGEGGRRSEIDEQSVRLVGPRWRDSPRASYGSAANPVGEFDEQLTFLGGTGRFQNASGEALASAVCDRDAGTCTREAHGFLRYDASDRRR